jgi:plasmid stabilization system protein ParE
MASTMAPTRILRRTKLDEIWYHLAKESGIPEIADRLIDTITKRFFLLADYPHVGHPRERTCGLAYGAFLSAANSFCSGLTMAMC